MLGENIVLIEGSAVDSPMIGYNALRSRRLVSAFRAFIDPRSQRGNHRLRLLNGWADVFFCLGKSANPGERKIQDFSKNSNLSNRRAKESYVRRKLDHY